MKKNNRLLILSLFLSVLMMAGSLIVNAAPPTDITNINGPNLVCIGDSVVFTVEHSGGADGYYWVTSGSSWSVASATTSSTFNIVVGGNSSATISVWAFNADGNSGTFSITREKLGNAVSITQPSGFHCTGVSKTYTVAPVTQAENYTWSISPSSWTVTQTSATWTEVIGGEGNAILTVWASNRCESSATITTDIIPSPPPIEILVDNDIAHCAGTTNTYTIAPVVGATSYSWYIESDDSGWNITSGTSATYIELNSATYTNGPVTILVASNNACASSATISKTLNPLAGPSGITVSPSGAHCSGTTKTYTVIPVEHADSYSWWVNASDQWSYSSSTISVFELTSSTFTNTSATISVAANNICGSSATYTTVIAPLDAPDSPESFSYPNIHCVSSSMTYSVTPVFNAENYIWDINNPNWSVSGTSNIVDITAGSGSATISVYARNDCGISSPIKLIVVPWTIPGTPNIIEPSYHCSSETATYSTSTDPQITGYTWFVEGYGWEGSSTFSSIAVTSGTGSGTISLVTYNSCGTSSTYSTEITPIFIPEAPDRIYTPPSHCVGETKSYACTPVQGASSYSWYISGTGWSGTSATNSISLTAGTGIAEIVVTANSACGSSDELTTNIIPNVVPLKPKGIDSPNLHCVGVVKTYSVPLVNGATNYQWEIINKSGADLLWSADSFTGENIDITAGSDTASLSVYAINKCGDGPAFVITLIPDTAPLQPAQIVTPASHCESTAQAYSIPEVLNAESYEWSVMGNGWSISSSNTVEVDVTAGPGEGIISVTAVNNCGQGLVRTTTIVPINLPTAPTALNKPNTHCEGTVEEYSVPEVSSATSYVWTVNGDGWSGVSTSETIDITAGVGEVNITIKAVNSCGEGPAFSELLSSIPLPSSAFTINRDTICHDDFITVSYTGDSDDAATYNWDFNSGIADPGTGKGPHNVSWLDDPGNPELKTIKLTVTEDGCESQEESKAVFVDTCLVSNVYDIIYQDMIIELMPNPSSGNVKLRILNSPYPNANLEVVDLLGNVVFTVPLTNISSNYLKELNFDYLESAVYFVKLRYENAEFVKKLILNR